MLVQEGYKKNGVKYQMLGKLVAEVRNRRG